MQYETLLKKIIEEKGWSYRMISVMTGIARSTISNYALGKRVPDVQTACKIIKVLQLDMSLIDRLFEPVY